MPIFSPRDLFTLQLLFIFDFPLPLNVYLLQNAKQYVSQMRYWVFCAINAETHMVRNAFILNWEKYDEIIFFVPRSF